MGTSEWAVAGPVTNEKKNTPGPEGAVSIPPAPWGLVDASPVYQGFHFVKKKKKFGFS